MYKIHWNKQDKCDCDFWFGVNVMEKHLNCHAKKIAPEKVRIYVLYEIIRENATDSLQDMRSERAIDVISDDFRTRQMYEYKIRKGFPISGFVTQGWRHFEFVWEEKPQNH